MNELVFLLSALAIITAALFAVLREVRADNPYRSWRPAPRSHRPDQFEPRW